MRQFPFIDMHVHLFNSHYLPLDGIFQSWNMPSWLSKLLASFATGITDESDFFSHPNSELDSVHSIEEDDDEALVQFFFERSVRRLTSRLFWEGKTVSELLDDPFIQAVDQIVNDYNDDVLGIFTVTTLADYQRIDDLSNSTGVDVHLVQRSDEAQRVRKALPAFFQEIENSVEDEYIAEHHHHSVEVWRSFRLMRFVKTLVSSERAVYRQFLADYRGNAETCHREPKVAVNLMMDMERAYDRYNPRPPRFEFRRDQLPRMMALTRENGGRIVTFAAVSPRRHNWGDYVREAEKAGIRGFKFYPPMGYRAANNPNYTPNINEKALPRKQWPKDQSLEMQARIDAFLNLCVQKKFRVFSHCTPNGFEAKRGWGLHADPEYWKQALVVKTGKIDRSQLFLCLGHGGGTRPRDWGGWISDSKHWEQTYAYKVVELCCQFQNVYCDLGYLVELIKDKSAAARFSVRFRELMQDEGTGAYPFRSKVMYGSDWHMPDMMGRSRDYLNLFYYIFDDYLTNGMDELWAEDFFFRNAERFLGLEQG